MPSNKIYDNKSQVRKVTLTSNIYNDPKSGLPYIRSFDVHGSQLNISASYLPAGVTKSTIQQGQVWWIEKRTNAWTLMTFVGEYNPYSYALFNSSKTWVPSPMISTIAWSPIIYDQSSQSVSSTLGSIVSDQTTGYIAVPNPGIYDIHVSAQLTNGTKNVGQLALQIVQPIGISTTVMSAPVLSRSTFSIVNVTSTSNLSSSGGQITFYSPQFNVYYSASYSGIIENASILGVKLLAGSYSYTPTIGADTVFPSKTRTSAWSSLSTGAFFLDAAPVAQINTPIGFGESSTNQYNNSFFVQAAWGGASVNIDNNDLAGTYASIAYRGPVS